MPVLLMSSSCLLPFEAAAELLGVWVAEAIADSAFPPFSAAFPTPEAVPLAFVLEPAGRRPMILLSVWWVSGVPLWHCELPAFETRNSGYGFPLSGEAFVDRGYVGLGGDR